MKPLQQWTSAEVMAFLKGLDRKSWIKIGIGGAVALVIWTLIIWPAWFKRPGVRNQVKFLESQIRTVQTLSLKKNEWLQNKTQFQQFIDREKQRIFKSGESAFLHGTVAKLAKESGVKVVSSRPKDYQGKFPSPYDKQYQANVYDFSLEGSYHNLGAFVARLESYPKMMTVQNFHLRSQDEAPGKQIADLGLAAISMKE